MPVSCSREQGRELRAERSGVAVATRRHALATAPPWRGLLEAPRRSAQRPKRARETLEEEVSAGLKRSAREIAEEAKRAGRRRRTEILDLGLELGAAWFRDLAAVASGASEVVYNRDRLAELQAQAAGLDPASPRRAAELIQDTRRRLELNVSEELALEALFYRLQRDVLWPYGVRVALQALSSAAVIAYMLGLLPAGAPFPAPAPGRGGLSGPPGGT